MPRTGDWPAPPPAPARVGGAVHYLGGYERKLAGGSNSPETITKYYSASFGAASRPVAFRRGGTLHWVGSDHLGGTIRVLDSGFTALDGMRYRPYGEDRDTGTQPEHRPQVHRPDRGRCRRPLLVRFAGV